jgi:hypothetical protein
MASLAACLAGNEEAFLPFLLVVLGFELRALRLLGRGTLVLPPVTLGSFYVCGCLRVLAGIGRGGQGSAPCRPPATADLAAWVPMAALHLGDRAPVHCSSTRS